MKTKYCCDRGICEDYYINQAGSGLPGFQGTRYQRGAGLGSMFSGLLRAVAPLLKSGAKKIGKTLLKKGMNIASNFLDSPRPVKNYGINRGVKRKSGSQRLAIKRRRRSDIFD